MQRLSMTASQEASLRPSDGGCAGKIEPDQGQSWRLCQLPVCSFQ